MAKRQLQKPMIMTIGHSTRTLSEFVELLHASKVKLLVDIRTIPKSRTNPQFNMDTLGEDLKGEKIEYIHMPELGGLRHPKANSLNTIWLNDSFRGYADYMETEQFNAGVDRLLKLAEKKPLAIMCSEAVWWRCHRSMVADELVARGFPVFHIMGPKQQSHTLRSFAHEENGHVSYRTAR